MTLNNSFCNYDFAGYFRHNLYNAETKKLRRSEFFHYSLKCSKVFFSILHALLNFSFSHFRCEKVLLVPDVCVAMYHDCPTVVVYLIIPSYIWSRLFCFVFRDLEFQGLFVSLSLECLHPVLL